MIDTADLARLREMRPGDPCELFLEDEGRIGGRRLGGERTLLAGTLLWRENGVARVRLEEGPAAGSEFAVNWGDCCPPGWHAKAHA